MVDEEKDEELPSDDKKKTKAKAQEDGKQGDSIRGNVTQREIVTELKESYIDYAMSVIVARALPDVRDGFKPVLRRILFGMYQMNNFFNQKHKKSARIV